MKHNSKQILFTLFLLCFSWAVFSQKENNQQINILYESTCGLNAKAAELAALIIYHHNQQREKLSCHTTLAVTAAKKAQSMASNQRIEHNLDYRAPNELLEFHGYLLPAEFLPTSNQVESVAGGKKTAQQTLDGLLNSHAHRSHLLGLDELSAQQIHIGVGYFYNPHTPHEHHWVIHIAQPRKADNGGQTVDYLKSVTNYHSKPSR